jgi:hypothetical protein
VTTHSASNSRKEKIDPTWISGAMPPNLPGLKSTELYAPYGSIDKRPTRWLTLQATSATTHALPGAASKRVPFLQGTQPLDEGSSRPASCRQPWGTRDGGGIYGGKVACVDASAFASSAETTAATMIARVRWTICSRRTRTHDAFTCGEALDTVQPQLVM